MRRRLVGTIAAFGVVSAMVVPAVAMAATTQAPGSPGSLAWYLPAGKAGFGTAHGAPASKVWFTVEGGRLSEIYYPNLSTPASRELDFIVVDGAGHAVRVSEAATQHTVLVDNNALEYRTTNTANDGAWKLTQTYITDPARSTVVADVQFESLNNATYQLFTLYDPSLTGNGNDDSAVVSGSAGLAYDGTAATALTAVPALTNLSVGYVGKSDGWTDLATDGVQNWKYQQATVAGGGNVAITAQTALNGTTATHADFYLGFDSVESGKGAAALAAAKASAAVGFAALEPQYTDTWHTYLAGLNAPPASLVTPLEQSVYTTSEMELAASEDKTYPGAYVASPSMPWIGGQPNAYSAPGGYHMVWPRDLYNIATGLIADGDTAGAERALNFLWTRMQGDSGLFPQFTWVDGGNSGSAIQLDETAFPILIAWQLHKSDKSTWTHVLSATKALIGFKDKINGLTAPATQEERWEEKSGYSPSTIASEIAALVAASDIAFSAHHSLLGLKWRAIAKKWSAQLEHWTVTTNGPLSADPYYLRLTPYGNPQADTQYDTGNTSGMHDQRTVVDAGFLELVRLGIRPASDPTIINSLKVVDANIGYPANKPMYWHRYSFDGYGESATGAQWGTQGVATYGRVWPLLTGERGEYELLAGNDPAPYLATMASSANEGGLIPEQAWDGQKPSGDPGFVPGTSTTSATPLEWAHAQFIRLAVDAAQGSVVERPLVVCRYFKTCK
jgi:glucoamylase